MASKKSTAKATNGKKAAQAVAAALTDVTVETGKEVVETAAKPAAKPAVETVIETVVETVVETVETAVKATAERPAQKPAQNPAANPATAAAADVLAQAKKQVEAATKVKAGGYGDFAVQGKENVEAMVRSGNIMAKGMETLGKEIMDFARVSIEGNVQATQAMFGAKTFQDMVALQSDHARKSMDQFLAEGAKLTELSVQVAGEAIAPIQVRVDLAVKQFVKPARF